MRDKQKTYLCKDDIKHYGPLIEVIANVPELLELFHSFKREKEAQKRQDRRHPAFYIPVENIADRHNTLFHILEREKAIALYKAIAKLTETQMRRVILRYWYELTYQQIATLENASRTAATKSIALALKKMRKEIYD